VNPWKLILATVIIFGAGVIMGGLLVFATQPKAKPAHHAPSVSAVTNRPPAVVRPVVEVLNVHQPEILSQQFLAQLDDNLQLNPAQSDAIHKIIACGQEQNRVIWTNCAAQTRQVLQEVKQHIQEQLSADQKKKFEKLLKQMHPAAHHGETNSVPNHVSGTNQPAVLTTNLAGKS
jgi:hypothetical protein